MEKFAGDPSLGMKCPVGFCSRNVQSLYIFFKTSWESCGQGVKALNCYRCSTVRACCPLSCSVRKLKPVHYHISFVNLELKSDLCQTCIVLYCVRRWVSFRFVCPAPGILFWRSLTVSEQPCCGAETMKHFWNSMSPQYVMNLSAAERPNREWDWGEQCFFNMAGSSCPWVGWNSCYLYNIHLKIAVYTGSDDSLWIFGRRMLNFFKQIILSTRKGRETLVVLTNQLWWLMAWVHFNAVRLSRCGKENWADKGCKLISAR